MWHICHNRGLADFAIMSNCVCLCLHKLQTADKHKHSIIYVTVASQSSTLSLCWSKWVLSNEPIIEMRQNVTPYAPWLDVLKAPLSWFSQEVFIIGLVLTSTNFLWTFHRGNTPRAGRGRCCQRYVASVKTKCHNIKVVNVWERAENSNETWDAEEYKS